MTKEDINKNYIKIIFSLISLFLMLPPLMSCDSNYYRSLFIFLINRVIDMLYDDNNNEPVFFIIWSLLNQWISLFVCAFSFCLLAPDFAEICKNYTKQINIILFVSAISCVLKELMILIIISIKQKIIKRKIINDLKGESL